MTVNPTDARPAPAESGPALPPGTPLLSVQNLTVTFGALVALRDVSFELQPSATLGVVGPNGAGKTTLLNVLSGYIGSSTGQVDMFGAAMISNPEKLARLGVGRSFQLADQFGRLSVGDFMMLGLATKLTSSFLSAAVRIGTARREEEHARHIVTEELHMFGLGKLRLSTRIGSLPYGIRKRLDIARAAIGKPRLLLVDEPTSGLSASECDEMAGVLQNLVAERGITLMIVDHRVNFVKQLCPSLLALDFGELIGNGPSDEVLDLPRVRRAYFGIADDIVE